MLLVELLCQICGSRFEAEVLDRENPREQHEGNPVRCPHCDSMRIERIRVKQSMERSAASRVIYRRPK